MNELLKELGGGDLRSDGKANEVAEKVIKNPKLLKMLVEGLDEPDDIIRARTAHAFEKISRTNPEMLEGLTPQLIELVYKDMVPMVKWHLAMIFGSIPFPEKEADKIISVLLHFLEDESVFVKSWSIVSLCIIDRKNKLKRGEIINKIRALQNHESIAIRSKVKKALKVLENENEPMPLGWIKAR